MKQAIVLGARPGNIGGAIVNRLNERQPGWWIAHGDDCWREFPHATPRYVSPSRVELEDYDACVITLGVTHMQPFEDQTHIDIHNILHGALELPLLCANVYTRARAEHGWGGHIVFIGSYAHDHPFTDCTTYCVAKAGLDMAARSLAWELMPDFKVHIIHPHHVQGTPMTDKVREGMMTGAHHMTAEEAEAYSRKDLRMPDILKPEEIAQMVEFLLTNPVADWLCGSGLNMYGGVR
jgi:NAD(P)-dependent dehydrogenase (short-subunit alcohol dehydrogenase family)